MIVAATDPGAREMLRARVLQTGLPCDEEARSAETLERSLDLLDAADSALVVIEQHEQVTLAPVALGRGVPVLIWPTNGRPKPAGLTRRTTHTPGRMTAREREILGLVAAGTSNKQIARVLRISPNTVKFHLTTLFGKLGVTTRAEAIAAAARSGELSL